MKAAIIGPIGQEYGGAEKLYDEMLENFNKFSDYDFELVVLKINTNGFWELIESYYNFFNLDLEDYDLAIVTKFPSWMVKCKKKILFMLHSFKDVYDTYDLSNLTHTRNNIINNNILSVLRGKEFSRTNFIKVYLELIKNKKIIEDLRLSIFPGPFIKEIIHFFDKVGINECERFFAPSNSVKNRKEYFPEGADIKIIYPPINDKKHFPKFYKNFLFTASRLHKIKRIDMLIKAFKKIENKNIKFKIAGEGSELENLKKLAKEDKRIDFLGFLSDKDIVNEYNNCLFVPFVPWEEDYGFIALEAMKSGKAVLTCKDSGGPLELVRDDFNGKIAKPNIYDIKNKMEELIKDKKLVKRMGENARQSVKDINWKNFVKSFNIETLPKNSGTQDLIVLNISYFSPPITGGQVRAFNLYKELSKNNKITFFNLTLPNTFPPSNRINKNLTEYNIAVSKKCHQRIMALEKDSEFPLYDMALISHYRLCRDYIDVVKKNCSKNKIIVCVQPYLFNLAKNLPNKYIIYDVYDVEYNLKQTIIKRSKKNTFFFKRLFKCEKELCKKAKFILTTSNEDKDSLANLYDSDKKKMINIPNGVDCKRMIFTEKDEKKEYKKFLGIECDTIGIFMDSMHKQANLDAVDYILKLAKLNKKTRFLIIGSCFNCFLDKKNEIPENVLFLGVVDDFQKQIILKASDFAINPIFTGGGANLKMFEYMAIGLPVITTEFGARGIDLNETDFYMIDRKLKEIDFKKLFNSDVKKNRKYVETNFDWKKIAKKYDILLQDKV